MNIGDSTAKAIVAAGLGAGYSYFAEDGVDMLKTSLMAGGTSFVTNYAMESAGMHNNIAQAAVAGAVFCGIDCAVHGTEGCDYMKCFLMGAGFQYIADVSVDGLKGSGFNIQSIGSNSIKSV